MIVCIMCPIMSLVATVLFKGAQLWDVGAHLRLQLLMALCWQMFYCGPLARFSSGTSSAAGNSEPIINR